MIRRALNMAKMLRHERGSRARTKRLQDKAFLRLFRHAYENVPFYRDLYRANGISIADIRSLADIGKLPVVSKEQLRGAAASGKLWGKTDNYRVVETSGSSGMPFRFYVSRHDNEWRKAQFLLPYVSTGRKPWNSVLRIWGRTPLNKTWPQKFGLYNETFIETDRPAGEHYEALAELEPDYLQGTPSVLRLLAVHMLSNNLPRPDLKKVYTDSELFYPETRALLKRAFNADVIDVFGSYETDNIAYECSEHSGYHLAEDSVVVETVTDGNFQSVDGTGELVCTVLHNTVTPFIRYNLGDLVGISSEPCGCGRTSKKLSVLHGRKDDLFTLPDGSKRSSITLIILCTTFFLHRVNEFQIRQIDASRFEIRLVPGKSFEQLDIEEFESAFSTQFPFARLTVRIVDRIERTAGGKYKAFIGLDSADRVSS